MLQETRYPDSIEGIVNVASVPQRSPFRYPGGKTWLIPQLRMWLSSFSTRPKVFFEPFAGGGIASLTVAAERLAERVVMVERDDCVAAIWKVVTGGKAETLAQRILKFKTTKKNISAVLSDKPDDLLSKAFQAFLRNRLARGGIMAPGASLMKNGENGRGITSRWYPETLARRVREIGAIAHRIQFIEGDAFEIIPKYTRKRDAVLFIDPPYTAGGKRAGRRLYLHNDVDHQHLFSLMANSVAPFMMTYDDSKEVRALAVKHQFQVTAIPMKNTHHNMMYELLVTSSGYKQAPTIATLTRRHLVLPLEV